MIPVINNIACKIGMLLTEVAPDGETVSVDTVSENTVSGNVLEQLGQVENAEDLKQELNVIGQMLAELPDKLARFAFKFIIALIIFLQELQKLRMKQKIISAMEQVQKTLHIQMKY